jgi:uncharacterized protein (DUF2267 family)
VQSNEFFEQVQERSGVESSERAKQVTSTVLGILGTLKLKGELRTAASQLPKDVAAMLLSREEAQTFTDSEFVSSVAEELNVESSQAESLASAVLTTLRKALSDGEFLDLNGALPSGFHRFLLG